MAGALGALLAACPSAPVTEPSLDAASAPVVGDAGLESPAVADAGPPTLTLGWVFAAAPDGGELALEAGDGGAWVDPASVLELELRPALRDYRVRLFDWTDRLVVSDDEATPIDGGLRYRLTVPSPLKPGRAYSVLVDAQDAAEVTSSAGEPLDDARLGLWVRGAAEPDKPAPAKRRRRR